MQTTLLSDQKGTLPDKKALHLPQSLTAKITADYSLSLCVTGHPLRAELKDYIARRYARRHQAAIEHFLPNLLALKNGQRIHAALGLSSARNQTLFLESYLDKPIEQAISQQLCTPVDRTKVVEIGNLAASQRAASTLLFAWQLRWISNIYDGLGYEISNAALQILIYAVILVLIAMLLKLYLWSTTNKKPLLFFMGLALSLSIIREGSEILIYFSGFIHNRETLSSGIIGSIIGAGVGFSFGALFYFLLSALDKSLSLMVALGLLVLVGAGMCSQASMLLMQADFLPSQQALWNTSSWIAEPSIPGQLLYALIGYEATPSPLQVSIYTGSIFISLIVAVVSYKVYSRSAHTEVSITP